jgi:heptaprenyl diphosphate synthase
MSSPNEINLHKMVLMAMFLAMAIALGIAESFIEISWVPGAKPGLANLVIILVLYEFGVWEAALIDLGKVFIVAAVRGTLFQMGFFMSLSGSLLSLLVMILLYYLAKKLTIIGVSAMGALFHDLGQIIVGVWYLGSWSVFYYFPFMMLIGLATGTLIGILADRVMATGVIERQKKQYNFH